MLKHVSGKTSSELFPEFLVSYYDVNTRYYQPYMCISNYRYKDDNKFFLVLPFHKVWHKSRLSAEVNNCFSVHRELLQEAFEGYSIFSLQISWKLCELPLGNTLILW